MSELQLIKTMLKYKAWANAEILKAMRLFDERLHADERHTAIRILNHTHVVDRIFAANLRELPHGFTATNTTETPELDKLSLAMTTTDEWYVDYVVGLRPEKLAESVNFTFTDGEPGRMSRAEMLAHVVIHGEFHRGAVGRIMTQHSIKPPDAFTVYLHGTEPAARRRLV